MSHQQNFELVSTIPLTSVTLPTVKFHSLPKISLWRWIAIPFVGVLQFTNYICYYNPQPLQTTFYKPPMSLTSTEYNILFSVYSFPNIIMTPIGGWLLDKKGLYFSMIVFVGCLILGQSIILIFGGGFNNYNAILVGRFFSGIGSENLSMAQKVILANWFIGNERIFAYGTNTSFAQLAIIITSSFVPLIYEAGGSVYLYPYLFSFLVAVLALGSSLFIILLDKRIIKKELALFHKETDEVSEEKSEEKTNPQPLETPEITIKELSDKKIEKALILNKEKRSDDKDRKMIRWADMKAFGWVFWLLVWSNYLSYGSFFTFIDNSNDLLVSNYQYEYKEAGHLLTLIFIISAIASPVFGYILKNIGKKMKMMMVSLGLFFIGLLLLIFFEVSENGEKSMMIRQGVTIPLILVGLFYAMNFSLIWTCISMVVDKNKMGSAFGVVYSSRNLNLVISPLIAGVIHDNSKESYGGYLFLEIFLLLQIVLAIVLTVWAWIIDYKGKRILV